MKQEIIVPNSLSDISLKQYQTFLKIKEANDSDEFIAQKMVSIFCNIKLGHVALIKFSSFEDILNTLEKAFNEDKKLVRRFELGGKEFGFIPDLEEISFGEYADLDNYIGDWQNMHKAMAVMYRPIIKTKGERYEIEPYNGSITYSEVMEYAPLNVVFGAMVFFYSLGNELLKATLSYLGEELEAMSIQYKHNLTSNGDGITQSMHSLRETLQNLKALQGVDFLNVSHILHTKSND